MTSQQENQPRGHPIDPSSTYYYSTLPEVVYNHDSNLPEAHIKCDLPEVAYNQHSNLPEVLPKYEFGAHGSLPNNPPSVQEEQKAQPRHPWIRFPRSKRNRCAVIAAILLLLVGIIIGIAVPVARRQQVQTQPQTEGGKAEGGKTDSTSSSTPTPPLAPSGSFKFGTPTSFPSASAATPLASVCQGTVCPQMLTSARLASSPSDRSTTFLLARGQDNAIWYRGINESKLEWASDWTSLGGNFLSQPAALSCDEGRIDVYAVWAEDRSTRTKKFLNGAWSTEWESIGGDSVSAPSACSLVKTNINVVAIDKDDNGVRQKFSSDSGRTYGPKNQGGEWFDLGTSLSSVNSVDIGCVQITEDPLIVRHNLVTYGKGDDGLSIFFKKYNTTVGEWDPEWIQGTGGYKGDPVVVSTVEGAHFFGVGTDQAIWFTNWTETRGYSKALSLGGKFQSAVSIVITGPSTRIHVLAVGIDGRLKHKACIGGIWGTEWDDLGGHFNSSPKAVKLSDKNVVVFGIGPDGAVIHSTFDVGTGYRWDSGQWFTDGGQISIGWYRDDIVS